MTAWPLPPSGTRQWPLAVGLVINDAEADTVGTGVGPPDVGRDRRWELWVSQRLAIAVAALDAGFFLLTTLETNSEEGTLTGWARLRQVASGADAHALFVLGARPRERATLEALATELRLVVRPVSDDEAATDPDGFAEVASGCAMTATGVLAATSHGSVGIHAGRPRSESGVVYYDNMHGERR